jgi:hypothetical protein
MPRQPEIDKEEIEDENKRWRREREEKRKRGRGGYRIRDQSALISFKKRKENDAVEKLDATRS